MLGTLVPRSTVFHHLGENFLAIVPRPFPSFLVSGMVANDYYWMRMCMHLQPYNGRFGTWNIELVPKEWEV